MQIPILKRIVALLKERREEAMEGGKKGRGILKRLIEEHVRHFSWLTRNMVDHFIATYTDDNLVPLEIITTNNQTEVSVLTDASPIALPTMNLNFTPESESVSTSKRGGRPAGSTKNVIEGRKSLVANAMDECAIQIANVKSMALHKTNKRGKTCRVPRGTFEKAIQKVCEKYNIERSEIKMETALSRNKVGRKLKVKHRGTNSPMAGIEGHLLAAILRRAALRQPVSCAEGLELANSLIEGTTTQLDLMAWKKANLKNGPDDDSFGSLGVRYWKNFCRRNADLISAKKAVRFDSKRDDWCRLDNFEDMYDDVYERLWEAGIAEKLDEAVWRDKDNNIVETQAEAYGRKTKYSLLHPEYLVMVDEVGENISQKGDGNAGGQKFMVASDMRAQIRNSFKDNHFTVLGFTAANGHPTMCAIIIAASKLKVTDVTGYNPLSDDAQDIFGEEMEALQQEINEMKDEHSNGTDRMFPFGPTCTFNGVEVPTFVTCSKNGSINSQLLTLMLAKMDEHSLFDRSTGINPFLLCDGHGSRFEEPFLEYTLESNTPWTCCIGVPYGTSVWQLGDSPEQNGTFKIESKKAKADTVRCKIRAGLPAALERSDIVRIVNIAWQKSFARVDTNLKAIAERGWGPLNYVLLDHPELQETKDRVESINDIYKKQVMDGVDITDLTSLNTDKGSMGLTMDMFLDNALQEKAFGKLTAAEKKEKRRQAGMLRKDGGARLSAGLMVITDGYAIGPDCLVWARRTRLEKEQKARERQIAGQLERLKLKTKVDAVLAKGATPETGKWNNYDLKVMIQWFKRDGDKAMPKNKEGLLLRYRETHTRVMHNDDDRGTYPYEDLAAAIADTR
jgi:hypothetical protein